VRRRHLLPNKEEVEPTSLQLLDPAYSFVHSPETQVLRTGALATARPAARHVIRINALEDVPYLTGTSQLVSNRN